MPRLNNKKSKENADEETRAFTTEETNAAESAESGESTGASAFSDGSFFGSEDAPADSGSDAGAAGSGGSTAAASVAGTKASSTSESGSGGDETTNPVNDSPATEPVTTEPTATESADDEAATAAMPAQSGSNDQADEPSNQPADSKPASEATADPEATQAHQSIDEEPTGPIPVDEKTVDDEKTDPDVTTASPAGEDRQRITHSEDDEQPTEAISTVPPRSSAAGEEDHTRPMPVAAPMDEEDSAERRRQETERRKAERDAALGTRRPKPDPEPAAAAPAKPAPVKRSTDKFFGSLGLFVLRIVMAALMALHGLTHVLSLDQTVAMIDGSWLGPMVGQSVLLAYVLGIAELLVAVALLFGFGVRIAGIGMVAIGALALAMVHWVSWPFEGFVLDGEPALMVAAVGFLFFATGGGGWSADRAVRARRAERKKAARR